MLQIPVTLGGAAIAYNLPGVTATIRLTRQVVADIYLGKILKWNDPQIAKLNHGVKLPDMPIVVVHRSDGSGTSYIFTDFLSHVSPEWKSKVGTGKSVSWPAPSAVGAKGNEGVAGQVRSTPGAIGYVELAYVVENHMPAATIAEPRRQVGRVLAGNRCRGCGHEAGSEPDELLDRRRGRREFVSRSRATLGSWSTRSRPTRLARKLLYDVLSWLVGPQGQANAKSVDYVPLPENVQAAAAGDAQADAALILRPSSLR